MKILDTSCAWGVPWFSKYCIWITRTTRARKANMECGEYILYLIKQWPRSFTSPHLGQSALNVCLLTTSQHIRSPTRPPGLRRIAAAAVGAAAALTASTGPGGAPAPQDPSGWQHLLNLFWILLKFLKKVRWNRVNIWEELMTLWHKCRKMILGCKQNFPILPSSYFFKSNFSSGIWL